MEKQEWSVIRNEPLKPWKFRLASEAQGRLK